MVLLQDNRVARTINLAERSKFQIFRTIEASTRTDFALDYANYANHGPYDLVEGAPSALS